MLGIAIGPGCRDSVAEMRAGRWPRATVGTRGATAQRFAAARRGADDYPFAMRDTRGSPGPSPAGAWTWVLVSGLGGLACFAGGLFAGFIGLLVGIDEALAARPFFFVAYALVLASFGVFGVAGVALVRALSVSGRVGRAPL